jgi:hypothetical protein
MSTANWQNIAGSKKKNLSKSEDKYVEKVFNWSEVHLSERTYYKIHTLVCPSNLAFWLRFCHLVSVSSSLGQYLHPWIYYFCPFFSSYHLFSFLVILLDFRKVFQI